MYHPSKFSFYLWRHLKPATNYSFTVAACSEFTRECGSASAPVAATTEDGLAGSPDALRVLCRYDNVSGMNFVDVSWKEPINKSGHIEFYKASRQVQLTRAAGILFHRYVSCSYRSSFVAWRTSSTPMASLKSKNIARRGRRRTRRACTRDLTSSSPTRTTP